MRSFGMNYPGVGAFWRLIGAALTVMTCTAAPAFAACEIQKFAEIPVTMQAGTPMLQAKINGVDVTLAISSAVSRSTLSPQTVDRLRLVQTLSNINLRGIGGEYSHPNIATAQTFTIAGQTIPQYDFLVAPGVGTRDGVIGQDILTLADAEFDLANGVIRLFKPQDCHADPLAYWAKGTDYSVISIDPIQEYKDHTIGDVVVNGVKLRVQFATGGGSSLSIYAAERIGIKMDSPDVKFTGISGGVGPRAVKNWIAKVASIKIGDEEIRNTQLRINDSPIGPLGYQMTLGGDFFLSHRVYVSNYQHKLYFTYNGGPVFRFDAPAQVQAGADGQQSASVDQATAEPVDAEGYARRGAAFAARHDLVHAIADLSKACGLAPTQATYFYQRAVVYSQNKQPVLAMADLDQTLKLDPKNVEALLLRANLRISELDKAAPADLDAASALSSNSDDMRLRLAGLYARADMFDAAVAQYDLWLAAHSGIGRDAEALSGRCRARATSGRDLTKALDDCNRALSAAPGAPAMLESRGLVELRLGDNDKAIADYTAALAAQPKLGRALFGRGLAEQRKGLKAVGAADIAAAVAINPRLPAQAKKYGIVGPDGT